MLTRKIRVMCRWAAWPNKTRVRERCLTVAPRTLAVLYTFSGISLAPLNNTILKPTERNPTGCRCFYSAFPRSTCCRHASVASSLRFRVICKQQAALK